MQLTEIPQPAQRFTNSDNPVIALEAIFIVILLAAYIFERRNTIRQGDENAKVLRELSEAVSELTGAINAKR